MDGINQAELRVRQLIELAHRIASEHFAQPSDDLIAMIFSRLCAEGDAARVSVGAQTAVGTVH